MVFLTMTSPMVEALDEIQSLQSTADGKMGLRTNEGNKQALGNEGGDRSLEQIVITREQKNTEKAVNEGSRTSDSESKQAGRGSKIATSLEPSLNDPKVGNPISHGQAIDLSRQLKTRGILPCSLDVLLRGAKVYVPPSPPKTEPTDEYKALMARLRREEEARSYERMTNPLPPMETFAQRFPASSAAHAFASNHYPAGPSDPFAENDEVTYADVDRQMALIFNIFLSIVACAAAIWVAARWWSTPARLALSMSGSMLVGVAEVVVYSGYIRRVGDAKGKEKSVKEIKKVMKTWVVGSVEEETNDGEKSIVVKSKDKLDDSRTRKRKKEISQP